MTQQTKNVKQQVLRRMEGKVAIVTGASRGMGAVTARLLAQEGAAVVLASRTKDAMEAIAHNIIAEGGEAMVAPTDVGDPGSVERLVKQTLDKYGRLDAAFNNAGSTHMPTLLADLSISE